MPPEAGLTVNGRVFTKDQYQSLAALKWAYDRGDLPRNFPIYFGAGEATVHVSTFDARGNELDSLRVFRTTDMDGILGQAMELLNITWELI